MISQTLDQVYQRVLDYADIRGQDTRHVPATVQIWINDSYSAIRTWSVTKGFREFITEGSQLTLPAAPDAGETYGTVPLPANAISLQGFDVFYSGRWVPLEVVDWEMRRKLQPRGIQSPCPRWFAVLQRAVLSNPTTMAAGEVAYFPFAAGLPYRLFTLDEWVPITNTAHLMIFPSQSWLDAVAYETALKVVALKDGDNHKRSQWVAKQLIDAQERIIATIPKLTQTGPKTMRRDANYRSGGWNAT